MSNKFVGRDNLVHHIRELFKRNNHQQKLRIQSIEGSGGLGKTTLLEHAIYPELLEDHQYLSLKINGDYAANTDIYDLVSALINSAHSTVTRHKKPGELFPKTNNVIQAYQAFKLELIKAYQIQDPQLEVTQISHYLRMGLELGQFINDAMPPTADYIRFAAISENIDDHPALYQKFNQLSQELNIMRKQKVSNVQILFSSASTVHLRNAFRENSLLPLAQAFVEDLAAILYKPQKRFDVAPRKIKGIDRLLLILDDFEALQTKMIRFLTENLLPELKKCEFDSFIFILGRDNLSNTSPNWNQHFQNNLLDSIHLKRLNQNDVYTLAKSYGITDEETKAKIWLATEGYPYDIQRWIAEIESGGITATSLKQFYTRMTRWLSEIEKSWLQKIVFLDVINVQNIEKMGFNSAEAQHINEWFQNEASLRDTYSRVYRFRPFVQSRILEYLQITDPEKFSILKKQAESAASNLQHLKDDIALN